MYEKELLTETDNIKKSYIKEFIKILNSWRNAVHKILGYYNIFLKIYLNYLVEKKVYPYFFYKNNSFLISKKIKTFKKYIKKKKKTS